MKYNNFIKAILFVAVLVLAGGLFTACKDDLNIHEIDESKYETNKDALGQIVSSDGKRFSTVSELREQGTTELFLGLNKEAGEAVSATFKFDQTVLDAYNKANGTSFELFPETLVTFDNGGAVELAAGSKKSSAANVTFKASSALKEDVTYAIPVKASITKGKLELSAQASDYLILVKDMSRIPSAAKESGIRIISCMEVNDTNPLNNLNFTLKKSGKPLIDVVILFSGNINYNAETGKVYNHNNPNVTHLLDNREKYLKPLQDRGIKVVLGILGNHDRAGVTNLSDATAREFAQELKSVCDAYNLDGIFFDDEYSNEITPAPPGFVDRSPEAASRLHYETFKAMPDKIVSTYAYSGTSTLYAVDGVLPGEYLSYGIHDYGKYWDLGQSSWGRPNYEGMPRANQAQRSQEYAQSSIIWDGSTLDNLRKEGYGAHMIFAMDPNRWNYSTQKYSMQLLAKHFFDDELVVDTDFYKKDWKE